MPSWIPLLGLLLASPTPPSPPPPPAPSEVQRLPPTVAAPELATEPEPGTEKGARSFVTSFMQARMARDDRRAGSFLSSAARKQFGEGEAGLALTGSPEVRFTGWDFAAVKAADASSFEVQVKIRSREGRAETAFTETLFVGPGPDATGTQRPWVIRGVKRGDTSPQP